MEIREIEAKSILNKLKQPDSWFRCRYTMNIYRGCEHGCHYCDGRSSKYWKEGENLAFSERVQVKTNAPQLLDKELRKIRKKEVLCMGGGVNDSYQPVESKYELTRNCLYYIKINAFPLHLMTKSTLIERDIEVIREIADKTWCFVSFSFSTPEKKWAKVLEPEVALPERRLQTMKKLVDAGISCGVTFMPILPYITDSPESLEEMFRLAKEHGASYVMDSPLTLHESQKEYFFDLMQKTPSLRRFVKRYERLYGSREAPYGKVMQQINRNCFNLSKKYNMPRSMPEFKDKETQKTL